MQNFIRVEGIVDIYKRKKGGKITVHVLPEKKYYYPKNENEFADIVINNLEFYIENKFKKKITQEDFEMPFGKHKGEMISKVPKDYLIWIYENTKCFGSVKRYIEQTLYHGKKG